MPSIAKDLIDHWQYGFGSFRGKVIWKLVLVLTLWNVWDQRNRRIFNNEKKCTMVVNLIIYQVSQWAAKCREFEGYSSADISRSWSSLFKDGGQKTMLSLSWNPPALGVLRMNFDGRYIGT